MIHSLKKQFINPPDEFTPIPFWFWNDHLTKEEIIRQIHDFKEKGVMGFVLHPRIGIPKDIIYLSDDFMELIEVAVYEADQLGMSVILYDEAMYPSGSAKGLVVQDNPEFASRGLRMLEYPCENSNELSVEIEAGDQVVSAQAVEKLSKSSICKSSITLLDVKNDRVDFTKPNENEWSILLFIEQFSEGTIRGIHFGEDDGEENAPPSVDLLNPKAVKKFIEITHDTYYKKLDKYFGNTIIAMFTDEPDILGRGKKRGLKPWTSNFLNYYLSQGNKESFLPTLWFETEDRTAEIRQKYQKTINKMLTESYYKQISEWCTTHNIALTGHPKASNDIGLLEYFQIPGQDVVWRWVAPEDEKALEGVHSTAGKCSSDAARHRGRRRNLNEFLGVCSKETDWSLSPGDMKWYMDWLLIRGVNLMCPHAFYYSVDGKRRSHERPPDVGPNNHWWPYYKIFAQYMKRLSWLMTDSTNVTQIAVLCEEDFLPWKIVKPLYENQIEFNYLEESLFLSNCTIESGHIHIENQNYTIIIIEDSTKLDSNMIQKLEMFISEGGKVIVCLATSDKQVIEGSDYISSTEEIVSVLPNYARHDVKLKPSHNAIRMSKVVKDNMLFHVFVNEGETNYEGTFRIKENGKVEKWDAWTAKIEEVTVHQEEGGLIIPLMLNRRESIVFCINTLEEPLVTSDQLNTGQLKTYQKKKKITLNNNWSITKSSVKLKDGAGLSSWHQWEGLEQYSGMLTYENTFEINMLELEDDIRLDLGEVYETVVVFLNGERIGIKMWAPYQFVIDRSYVKNGENHIKIEVTNSMANQMDHAHLASGLIGNVVIQY